MKYSCISKIICDWYFSWLLLHVWVGTVSFNYFFIYEIICKINTSLSMMEILSTPYLWIIYFMDNKWKCFLIGRFPSNTWHTSGPSSYILPKCSNPSLTLVALYLLTTPKYAQIMEWSFIVIFNIIEHSLNLAPC